MSNTNDAPAHVGPSVFAKTVIGPMSKLLNPLVATLAGRRHFPMVAQIQHVGRRTGNPYVTSVGAGVLDGAVLIPLTFGNGSDWARNVRVAGRCSVRSNGVTYHAVAPRFINAADAAALQRDAFNPMERLAFRMLGIRQFMYLQLIAS